jgi:amino acid adenylation domain-containing protein
VRFHESDISNGLLLHKTLRLAACLRDSGIGPQQRVGVCMQRGPDVLVTLLALWCCRAVYVPLDPSLPRERLLAMADAAGLDILITQPDLQQGMATLPCPLILLQDIDFTVTSAAASSYELPESTAAELAYILFTSGSSGPPKGVLLTQGNLALLFASVLPLLGLGADQRVLACASFSFDIAFFELLGPLLTGGSIVLADQDTQRDPQALARLIQGEAVSVVQATPSLWQLLNHYTWQAGGSVRLALSTGEALPRPVAKELLARTPALWNLYGPTECTLWASAHQVRQQDVTDCAPPFVSIGTALPGYVLALLADTDSDTDLATATVTAVPADRGELLIAGAGVGAGYCGANSQSSGNFSEYKDAHGRLMPCYRSGDWCRRDGDGLLHLLGRRDRQVKHNGYRIELDEISGLLQSHASIRQAECLLRPADGARNSLLFACVVFASGTPNKNHKQLNQYLARTLPQWMLPQRYYFLDSLPLNANGKLDRAALLTLGDAPARLLTTGEDIESRIAQVFCEVLEIDSIGPYDSFLDAGGNSMLGATLVLTLNERFGSRISLRQALVTPPTVSSIARLLQADHAVTATTRAGSGFAGIANA